MFEGLGYNASHLPDAETNLVNALRTGSESLLFGNIEGRLHNTYFVHDQPSMWLHLLPPYMFFSNN
jgi:hypothetical protein